MKRVIVLVSLVMLGSAVRAQISVQLSAGYGSYSMKDMKAHQDKMMRQFPVQPKAVYKFPAYWNYEFGVRFNLRPAIYIGAGGGFASTGGRLDYADYSGQARIDQLTRCTWLYSGAGLVLNPRSKYLVDICVRFGPTFGKYQLQTFSDLTNDNEAPATDALNFVSVNYAVEGGVTLSRNIFRNLNVRLYGGYNQNALKGNQLLSSDRDLYLMDDQGNKIKLDWSGFRTSLSVGYRFDRLRKNQGE